MFMYFVYDSILELRNCVFKDSQGSHVVEHVTLDARTSEIKMAPRFQLEPRTAYLLVLLFT